MHHPTERSAVNPLKKNRRLRPSVREQFTRLGRWAQTYAAPPFIAMCLVLAGIAVFMAGYTQGLSNVEEAVNRALSAPEDSPGSYQEPPTPALPVCGAPTSDNPGKEITEPTDDTPFYEPEPTISCAEPEAPSVAPEPDVVVLLSPNKGEKLPRSLGGMDCERSDGWQTLYNACDPRPFTDPDVKEAAKKLLTKDQFAFVNDNASEDAIWAFDIKEVADLKEQVAMPTATADDELDRITVYTW
jgi:hypothetical protein